MKFNFGVINGIIVTLILSVAIVFFVYFDPATLSLLILKIIVIYTMFYMLYFVLNKHKEMSDSILGIIAFLIIFFNGYLFYVNHFGG